MPQHSRTIGLINLPEDHAPTSVALD